MSGIWHALTLARAGLICKMGLAVIRRGFLAILNLLSLAQLFFVLNSGLVSTLMADIYLHNTQPIKNFTLPPTAVKLSRLLLNSR